MNLDHLLYYLDENEQIEIKQVDFTEARIVTLYEGEAKGLKLVLNQPLFKGVLDVEVKEIYTRKVTGEAILVIKVKEVLPNVVDLL